MTPRETAKQKARNSIELSNIVRRKRMELALLEDKLWQIDADFIKFVTENKDELPDIYERLEKEQRGDVWLKQ